MYCRVFRTFLRPSSSESSVFDDAMLALLVKVNDAAEVVPDRDVTVVTASCRWTLS